MEMDQETRWARFVGSMEGLRQLVNTQPRGMGVEVDTIAPLIDLLTGEARLCAPRFSRGYAVPVNDDDDDG